MKFLNQIFPHLEGGKNKQKSALLVLGCTTAKNITTITTTPKD